MEHGGAKGSSKVVIEPHKHDGIHRQGQSVNSAKNLVPGESVRVWNPFRSNLAAGVLGGIDKIFIAPGTKVLYLDAAGRTSISHVANIVGAGVMYPVEFSARSGHDLINMARQHKNVTRASV